MKAYGLNIFWFLLPFLSSCNTKGPGYNDHLSNNIDSSDKVNDGSCIYDPVWVKPIRSLELSAMLCETSGLIFWDGSLWTHNDNEDTRLFRLDTSSAVVNGEYRLNGVVNTNWEEVSQDENYIYVGDFGNNASGKRSDLHILRIEKSSLLAGTPSIDTIWFKYSDQTILDSSGPNQTEYDCEAMIAFSDAIYLFTKQWISGKTTIYSCPKAPGSYTAQKRSSFPVGGFITGATALESHRLVVLCGYNGLLQPFLLLLYDFHDCDFFSGKVRKVNLSLPFHQIEGIASVDGLIYYLSNELYEPPAGSPVLQKLNFLSLKEYLSDYLDSF